jgi:hypothetical protein
MLRCLALSQTVYYSVASGFSDKTMKVNFPPVPAGAIRSISRGRSRIVPTRISRGHNPNHRSTSLRGPNTSRYFAERLAIEMRLVKSGGPSVTFLQWLRQRNTQSDIVLQIRYVMDWLTCIAAGRVQHSCRAVQVFSKSPLKRPTCASFVRLHLRCISARTTCLSSGLAMKKPRV